jgi:hypothetical protein
MWQSSGSRICGFSCMELETAMKDFSNASFSPDLIAAMDQALQSAVATLPDPVSSVRVQNIAESFFAVRSRANAIPGRPGRWPWWKMQLRSDER